MSSHLASAAPARPCRLALRCRVITRPVSRGHGVACRPLPLPPACVPAVPARKLRHGVQAQAAVAVSAAPADTAAALASTGLQPALLLAARVLRPDGWLLAGLLVTLTSTIATTLAFPVLIGNLFDVVRDVTAAATAGPMHNTGTIAAGWAAGLAAPPAFHRVLLGLVTCLIFSTLGNAAIAVLSPLLAERFAARLKDRLVTVLLRKEQSFFDQNTKGDLLSRITLDVTVLQTTLSDYLGQRGFRSCFEVAGCLALMTWRQPILALVALLVTPVLSRMLRSVVVRSTHISNERQQAASQAMEFASERLRHVQTVQVFEQQGRESVAFSQLSEAGYRLAERYAVFQGVVEGAGRMAINIGTLALLSVGGWLVLSGRTSVGTVLAAQVQCLFLSVGLSSVAASLGELGKAIGALERIAALADAASDSSSSSSNDGSSSSSVSVTSGRAPAAASQTKAAAEAQGQGQEAHQLAGVSGRIEFRDVWFRYPGRQSWALQAFSLTIEPGSTVALVGASGGGKSTVTALLLGLYQPQRGSILIDGRPTSDPGYMEALRPHIAAVLQQPMLMQASVADLIRYGRPEASMEEVAQAASAANADSFIRQLPRGYETRVGERGHTLSGGQKQRLSIARALITKPNILVLDEVTSALDVESEMAIDRTLQLLPGCTKLMVAHRLSTVRHADSIAVVAAGRVVEQGTHDQLAARPGGAYWRLLQSAELAADSWAEAAPQLATASAD